MFLSHSWWLFTYTSKLHHNLFPAALNVETTSIQRWFNILTLNQCWIDVVSMLCACWVYNIARIQGRKKSNMSSKQRILSKQLKTDFILTLKTPSKICSRRRSKIFFYFSEKTSLDISCESSAKQTIHIKYQDLFSLKSKKKKKKKKLSSAAVVIGTLRVKKDDKKGSLLQLL